MRATLGNRHFLSYIPCYMLRKASTSISKRQSKSRLIEPGYNSNNPDQSDGTAEKRFVIKNNCKNPYLNLNDFNTEVSLEQPNFK